VEGAAVLGPGGVGRARGRDDQQPVHLENGEGELRLARRQIAEKELARHDLSLWHIRTTAGVGAGAGVGGRWGEHAHHVDELELRGELRERRRRPRVALEARARCEGGVGGLPELVGAAVAVHLVGGRRPERVLRRGRQMEACGAGWKEVGVGGGGGFIASDGFPVAPALFVGKRTVSVQCGLIAKNVGKHGRPHCSHGHRA